MTEDEVPYVAHVLLTGLTYLWVTDFTPLRSLITLRFLDQRTVLESQLSLVITSYESGGLI